jgi:Na+-driven multidrug efflux pump
MYLTIVALSYGFLGIVNLTAAAFNGLKMPLQAAAVAGLRLFGLLIPLAWVGRELAGLPGVFWGVAAGNVISGAVAFLWYTMNRRRRAGEAIERDGERRSRTGASRLEPAYGKETS